jgi:hypothetical protein
MGGPLAGQEANPSEPPVLRLKSARVPVNLLSAAKEEELQRTAALAPEPLARGHWIVQFEPRAFEQARDELERRGVRVLEYVPDHALLVSSVGTPPVEGLAAVWAGVLEADGKLSALLSGTPAGTAVEAIVEFHLDVEPAEARARVLERGLELLDNPDLAPRHVMVRAAPEQLYALAALDEVSYVFPASEELVGGNPVVACLGGASAGLGAAANLATSFGDGWDGKGLGAATLSYWLGPVASRLGEAAAREEIENALAAWASVVQIRFSRAASSGGSRSLDIWFAPRSHGDSYTFDGPGGVLAHTFYPPPNSEPLAGDVHLDIEEPWRIGADVDVFSVVLHELGHALGLGHNDDSNSVMYPYYRRVNALRPADITEIRKLYAAASDSPATPTPAPATPVQPQTPTQPQQPAQPSNPTQPPAAPTPKPGPDTSAPVLTVTSPALTVSATSGKEIVVRGTASDNVGVAEVVWTTSSGKSGSALGTSSFTAGPIPLSLGMNSIRITARDAAGNQTSRILSVTRR